jgi:hypothetical protein
MRWLKLGSAGLLVFALAACEEIGDLDDLEVVNENNPEAERALAAAEDIEAVISSGFFLFHQGNIDWRTSSMMLLTTADEGTESWGNYAVNDMSSEPRQAWNNSPSYGYAYTGLERTWYKYYEALSAVYDGIKAIQRDQDEGGSVCTDIDCDRALAFAKFIQGIAHGYLALQFDSAFVFDEEVDVDALSLGEDSLPPSPYPNVAQAALGYLQEAIDSATGASWELPSAWIRGNSYSAADFVRVVNAYYVRIMVQVNRSPTDRDNINWNEVANRVDAGLQPGMTGIAGAGGDVWLQGDASETWYHQALYFGAQSDNSTWARADYKTIGWTDQSAGYTNWLATPVADRQEFPMNSADARIHPPGDPTGWGKDFFYQGSSSFRAERGTYHFSMYGHHRYDAYPVDPGTDFPLILYEAQQLYKAEALYRTNDPDGAATIVNLTRVDRGEMTAATGADADLYDKIIYEHLIENFLHCPGCAYFNKRGWGQYSATGPNHHWGLVEGSPLHWPIPGQELEILGQLNYTYGGVGSEGTPLDPATGPAAHVVRKIPARMLYAFNGLDTMQEKLDFIWTKEGKPGGEGVRSLVRH